MEKRPSTIKVEGLFSCDYLIVLLALSKRVPIYGTIKAGLRMLVCENISGYEYVPEDVNVDFCLKVKENSMIGAHILDGDLVFIRKQAGVENGEIAAVLIDGQEATLKRFYKTEGKVTLRSENQNNSDQIYTKKDMKEVRILGKAIRFQLEVR